MKCPIDGSPLSVSSRDGVEIDFCPQCRGVWLDRGELDKIIDRAMNALGGPPSPNAADDRSERYDRDRGVDRDERSDHHDGRRGREGHHGRRERDRRGKRGFLDDLFDFG